MEVHQEPNEGMDVHVDPAVMFVSNIDDWPPLRAQSDICTPPPRPPTMGADKDVGEGIVEGNEETNPSSGWSGAQLQV